MRTMIAYGRDARGRGYELYDYGVGGYAPKTINGVLNESSYRYWCFYDGRTFFCTNNLCGAIEDMKSATEESRFYGSKGSFVKVA